MPDDNDQLARLEAVLYASGSPVSLTTIVAHLKLDDEREASDLLDKLTHNYEKEGSAMEIVRLPKDRVVLQLKPDYTKQAKRFSMKPLLTEGPLKTLSYVAYHQPVEQTEIAMARGSHAYGHLKMLEDMGLISREKKGRTKVVRTTRDFADYLGIRHDRRYMRRQLRSIFKKLEMMDMEKK